MVLVEEVVAALDAAKIEEEFDEMVDLGKGYQEVKRYLGVSIWEAKYVLVTVLP